MEKIVEVQEVRNKHEFYCDECGSLVFSSYEYDDGYCEQLGWFTRSVRLRDKRYGIRKCLCDSCYKDMDTKNNKLIGDAIDLFTKNGYVEISDEDEVDYL